MNSVRVLKSRTVQFFLNEFKPNNPGRSDLCTAGVVS